MTDDLVTWLRAQVQADRDLAVRVKARLTARGEYAFEPGAPPWPTSRVAHVMRDYSDPEVVLQGDLIEMFNPDRVIDDAEADLRIIDLHVPVLMRKGAGADYYVTALVCRTCGGTDAWFDDGKTQVPGRAAAYPCPTLKLMAVPYAKAGREGYREEWRP